MKTLQKTLRLPVVTCDELEKASKERGCSEADVIRQSLEAAGFTVPAVERGNPDLRKGRES